MAASFKSVRQVLDVAMTGAGASTVGASVMHNMLAHPITDTSIAGFANDWKKAFGDTTIGSLIRNSEK